MGPLWKTRKINATPYEIRGALCPKASMWHFQTVCISITQWGRIYRLRFQIRTGALFRHHNRKCGRRMIYAYSIALKCRSGSPSR